MDKPTPRRKKVRIDARIEADIHDRLVKQKPKGDVSFTSIIEYVLDVGLKQLERAK